MGRSLNLSREIYLLRMRDGILKSVHWGNSVGM
jgi:hypothetical protein